MNRPILLVLVLLGGAEAAEVLHPGHVIQHAVLDETRPYFVATHPRVTTTIRFPRAIEPPEGAVGVFGEDARVSSTEYVISWQPGDSFFTLVAGRDAKLANLNVPFEGRTFVFYFYPATDPLKAVAAVNLTFGTETRDRPRTGPDPSSARPREAVQRASEPPKRSLAAATPNRLMGLLDRMKLVHATKEGPQLEALARAMALEIVVCGPAAATSLARLSTPVTDAGWYQLLLLRVVRDPRVNAIGFIGLLRNVSGQTLVFDPASFGVRAGTSYYSQRISDAPAVLPPGAQSPVYFVIQPGAATPLSLANAWRVSVDLLSPAMNPGAALLREFAHPPTR